MEMEVMMPSQGVDFNFDSACTTPYISAPSSPQRFGTFFYSAPTSPTRSSAFYQDFIAAPTTRGSSSVVPFRWEEKPGVPKSKETENEDPDDDDFAFDFSGQLEMRPSLSADELFDGGKIKPLKPPPRLQYESNVKPADSPKSPKSPKRAFKEAFSPRHKRKDFDPFAAALEEIQETEHHQRGRDRKPSSNSRQKGTRSLSPLRVSDLLFDRENNQEETKHSSASSLISLWYRKWKLKDLLLFRSASEGRPSSKEQLRKYAVLKKSHQDDLKNSSFRSTDSVGSVSSRRRGPISAHELHYTANRAVSEELKKKTFLPYRQGLLGCLGFNSAVQEISKGITSMTR